ncbi:hypothetical protein [Neptunicella sp. SCSIO 80796]|uniref:hypothetical protein n=1 Tax=Neptunicella plasticusilytica TaxID=3117012 RepID=UPI003A4D84DB
MELQFRFTLVGFSLGQKYGSMDKDYLRKIRKVICKQNQPDKNVAVIKLLDMLIASDESQFKTTVEMFKADENMSVGLKKYSTALMDSSSAQIAKLPIDIQSKLYELKNILNIYNQEVDWTREHFKLTFDSSLTSDNHKKVCSDLRARYADMQGVCNRASDKIQEILECKV